MKKKIMDRTLSVFAALTLIAVIAGCANLNPSGTESVATQSPPPDTTETVVVENTPEPQDVVDPNILYQDDFTNPETGWTAETFDNYFIGYHEPEYYHIAIASPNYKTTVFVPNKPIFDDAAIEVNAFTFAGKTAETGDFRYGIVFRRSGDQYYAFTVSQRTKTWAVLKSTGSGIVVLQEGSHPGINDFDVADALRVDAYGSSFSFHINGNMVTQVEDADYASGEVGFYVQSLDAASLHIHYDSIAVSKLETSPQSANLYQDDFTNPETGWPAETFDNYFIGYHEPEYYHIAITSPNYKTTVFIPDKPAFDDSTIEVNAFTFAGKTAETGDFRYGIVFRRSGDQYYAFTVSQRAKTWAVLKSTGSGIVVLQEGSDSGINDFDVADALRVDAKGSSFSFHINGKTVAQIEDADYASGEVGFYVQSIDAASLHIHYDSITISDYDEAGASQPPQPQSAILYNDIFTDPTTEWPAKTFDNYFIGYHEPEYYHIAITSPNYKTTVFIPEKPIFSDMTIEVNAFTFAGKTAETGDFRYGIVFRRSGDQFYAFTVSQRTKTWAVLKSTPNELLVLKEGTSDSLNDFDIADILRVDAKGSTFFFHINDEFIVQLDDPDYAEGEVGFFVQTLDAASLHIHFDSITVREFEPRLVCTITALQMNIRSGPGTSYTSTTYLSQGDIVVPVGLSPDGEWIYIKTAEGNHEGWIANVPAFVSCNSTLEILPTINP